MPAQLELCANGLLSSSLQQMFYEWIRLRNHENLSGAENFVKMSLGNQRGKYFLVELEQQRCRYPSFIPVTFLFISLYILRIYAEHLMDFSELRTARRWFSTAPDGSEIVFDGSRRLGERL